MFVHSTELVKVIVTCIKLIKQVTATFCIPFILLITVFALSIKLSECTLHTFDENFIEATFLLVSKETIKVKAAPHRGDL